MTTTADELCATGSTAAVPGAVRTSGRGFRLRPVAAFAGTALAFVAVALAVGAPSPLFVLYEQEWGFAPWLLTVAFAIYAVTLLITLLVAGSLSDHIGRRPVLIGALALQVVAMLMFLFATDIGWIIAARSVQGVATGAAMSTFTAALVELAPEKQKKLGATIGSTAPVGGIALGAFFTGLAVQFASAPTVLVFVTLALLFAAGIVVVAASPETVRRRPGAVRSLVPRLVIPRAARGEFVGAIPLFLATWMLAGLFIGLSPSILHGVFHLDSGLLNGAIVAVPPAVGAVAGLALTRAPAPPSPPRCGASPPGRTAPVPLRAGAARPWSQHRPAATPCGAATTRRRSGSPTPPSQPPRACGTSRSAPVPPTRRPR